MLMEEGQRVAIELAAETGCAVAAELVSLSRCPTQAEVPSDTTWCRRYGSGCDGGPEMSDDEVAIWWRGHGAIRFLRRLVPFRVFWAHVSEGVTQQTSVDAPSDTWRSGGGGLMLSVQPLAVHPSSGVGLACVEAPAEIDLPARKSPRFLRLAAEINAAAPSSPPAPQFEGKGDLPHILRSILLLLFATPPDDAPQNTSARLSTRLYPSSPAHARMPFPLCPVTSVVLGNTIQHQGVTFFGVDVTPASGEGWRVWRRYQAFSKLRDVLPPSSLSFPGRTVTRPSGRALEVRRKGLEAFLN
eukprot:Hpha_TRINITY_DN30262_c0_g1::TRINITY_DN30262_c0_g1_i1::g.27117::m.27117